MKLKKDKDLKKISKKQRGESWFYLKKFKDFRTFVLSCFRAFELFFFFFKLNSNFKNNIIFNLEKYESSYLQKDKKYEIQEGQRF